MPTVTPNSLSPAFTNDHHFEEKLSSEGAYQTSVIDRSFEATPDRAFIITKDRIRDIKEKDSLSLFTSPWKTLKYFMLFVGARIVYFLDFPRRHTKMFLIFLSILLLISLIYLIDGDIRGLSSDLNFIYSGTAIGLCWE